MKEFTTLLLVLFSALTFSQDHLGGKVVDEETEEPLAFVNILFDDKNIGVSTDIDGKFKLPENVSIQKLTFSYIGYERKVISTDQLEDEKRIVLTRSTYDLNEVVVLPGVNPAHRIIDLAIENRKINNPEKATEFFYESYNKLIFTALLDSNLRANRDSVEQLDLDLRKTFKLLQQRHLFMMESVTERSHIPPSATKEVVTASRVSGLKNPTFSLIGTQLQSFSLYKDFIELFGVTYLSPISKGATSKYLFVLEDTLFDNSDTIFRLSFQPKKGKNFEGLKGFISINTNKYAVQNFVAEPFENQSTHVKIQQKYQFVDNKQWFPVQLNTFLTFEGAEFNGLELIGIGKSYIKNIQFQSPLNRSQIGNTILKMDENAGQKDSLYWSKYRIDPLDNREQNTYHFIDSIGRKFKLDEKMAIYKTILTGGFPLGPIDFKLKHLINYNGYEGFRLGLGIETNERFLKPIRIGGYGAYGFKDKNGKHGAHIRWIPKSERFFETKFSYSNDVAEVGGVSFLNQKYNLFSVESFRDFFISRMDKVEKFQGEISFRALRNFHFTFFGNKQNRELTFDYAFLQQINGVDVLIDNRYNISQTGINIRYKHREKFVEMFGMKMAVPSNTPTISFKYTKAFKDVLDGDFDYIKIDFQVDQQVKIRGLGQTKFRVTLGAVDEPLPISLLYRARGTFDNDYRIASEYNFETMAPNEFYSDRYLNVFFRHSFKNLLFKEKSFKPIVTIVSSFGLGDINSSIAAHQNVNFNTLEQGFFESGIQLDNLIESMGIGVGAFYRYGAYYNSEKKGDNIAVKISSTFSF